MEMPCLSQNKLNITYLGLGTNLGNKKENLNRAIKHINEQIGRVISRSSFYDTAPWGFRSENRFLNAVVKVETSLMPEELLDITQTLEKEAGRTKKTDSQGYSDRLIDIDILFFNDIIFKNDQLEIPHPQIPQRDFILLPLVEIAPDLRHPILNRTMRELLQTLLTKEQS